MQKNLFHEIKDAYSIAVKIIGNNMSFCPKALFAVTAIVGAPIIDQEFRLTLKKNRSDHIATRTQMEALSAFENLISPLRWYRVKTISFDDDLKPSIFKLTTYTDKLTYRIQTVAKSLLFLGINSPFTIGTFLASPYFLRSTPTVLISIGVLGLISNLMVQLTNAQAQRRMLSNEAFLKIPPSKLICNPRGGEMDSIDDLITHNSKIARHFFKLYSNI